MLFSQVIAECMEGGAECGVDHTLHSVEPMSICTTYAYALMKAPMGTKR